MYSQLVTPAQPAQRAQRFNTRQVLAGLAIVGLGLCAVLFAVGEESEGDTDSVRNLLLATKASMPQLANLNRLKHMTAKQQILYDSGMEDEADKNMNIAYQTFMKGKDEGVLAEYDNLNATISEEQDALVDYADEMGAIQLEVEAEYKEHKAQYDPVLPSQ